VHPFIRIVSGSSKKVFNITLFLYLMGKKEFE
jgi:hypothetical protein